MPTPHRSIHKRLAGLLLCLGIGVLVGAAGTALTGSTYWYIAIPVAVALGWLVVANPSECEPPVAGRDRSPPGNHNAP
jgi:hypothetical protein